MKLKFYNQDNTISTRGNTRFASVSITYKSGKITFNRLACEKLSRTKVEFVQDEARIKDWYFITSASNAAYTLKYAGRHNFHGKMFQNKDLVESIYESCGFNPEKTVRMRLGGAVENEGKLLHCILTMSGLKNLDTL